MRPQGFGSFIFNPADLAEDVELDGEIRKEVLFLDAHLDKWHHYDLLGVRPSTPLEEVRRCYLELSRRFHPDRYYGKRLGTYAARITKIFQAMTKAHETLSNPARKAEYDRVTVVPLTASEETERLKAEQARARDAADAERRRQRLVKTNPFLRNRSKQAELVKEAESAASREDWKQAANLFRLALGYSPNDPVLQARMEDADKRAGSLRAEDLVQRAESALVLGRCEEAARLYREAATAAPRDIDILLARARFLLSTGGAAAELLAATRQATVVGRANPQAWNMHGRALLLSGDKKEAREAFQRALKMDPRNAEAKEAVKKLRWVIF